MNQSVLIQRIEGGAIFALSIFLYGMMQGSWLLFIILFLAVDISMAGYLKNPRLGALTYNIGHNLTLPVLLFIAAVLANAGILILIALIWAAHIGLDRAMGYGLKLPQGFEHTHLGKIGRG